MKLTKASSILALLVLFLLAGSTGAYAAEEPIPAPRGDIYVQDFANVLSPADAQQLRDWGRQIEDSTGGAQVAVLTVNTIGEEDIESYANRAYRTYKLGRAGEDNGVLLVVALNDKKLRIEVGYGLEGIIPDGKAGRILDTYAIPSLRMGDPAAAVVQTYKALGNEITGNTDGSPAPPQGGQNQEAGGGLPNWLVILLVVGFIIVDMVFFGGTFTFLLLSLIGRGGGGGGPRGGGGGSSGGGGASRGW